MIKRSDKQSKKDWEDEFDEMESIYKFPYPENLGDAKSTDPSDSLSIILTTPITMHKNIAKSRKTYSRLATRPMIGLGETEKFVIDTQLKRKLPLESKSSTNKKKPKNVQKLPIKEDPIDQGNLNAGSETHDPIESKSSTNKKPKNVQKLPKKGPIDQGNLNVGSETHDPIESTSSTNNKKPKKDQKLPKKEPIDQGNLDARSETHDLFTRNLPEVKYGKISVKAQSKVLPSTGYHRTRKNLKRKLEEEKKMSANDSTYTLQLPIQNITDSKLQEEVVNPEENSEESSNDLNLNFQPPPPAQKLSLMALVQKYSESIDPSQPEEVAKKSRKPVKKAKQEKTTCTVSKMSSIKKKIVGRKCSGSVVGQKNNSRAEANEELPEAAESLLLSKSFPAIAENNEISNSISSNQKIISHMNMRESLIQACKEKMSNAKDSAMLSTGEKSMNLNLINTDCDKSLNGGNTQSNTAISNSSCVSSNTVVERIVSVRSVISRENTCETEIEPDFQIQHRTSYLQSADFFCAFMSEINAKNKESVSETLDETGVTNDVSVRQFCSSPNVNDAFSEILNGCSDVGDGSSPNISYEFPDNFLEKPFQLILMNYVDWLLDIMIPCKNNISNCYFSSKYILDFSFKHMSYQECSIMSMVFNDPKENLLLSSIAAKLSFVGMVIIFNAYLKETCKPR